MELELLLPIRIVPEVAAWMETAPAPLPPLMVVTWPAAPIDPTVTATVPVVVPPSPMWTALLVEAPGTPVAMLTVLPPAVVELPAPMLIVWVELVPLAEEMLTVEVAAVVAWPIVIVPVVLVLPMV